MAYISECRRSVYKKKLTQKELLGRLRRSKLEYE